MSWNNLGSGDILIDGIPLDRNPILRNVTVTEIGRGSGVVATFGSGAVAVGSGGLGFQFRFRLPASHYGTAQGVLGNPNGIRDDLMARDGRIYDPTLSGVDYLSQEYEFCQTWCITEAESLFVYPLGSNHATYDDCDDPVFYVPPSSIPPAVENFCLNDRDCIIDLLATNNQEIAAETRRLAEAEGRIAGLASFYSFNIGSRWDVKDNWLFEDPCAQMWFGIDCVTTDGGMSYDVTDIALPSNNLEGFFRTMWDRLRRDFSNSLAYVDLSGNKIYGDLGNLVPLPPALVSLDLTMNSLTGEVPLELCGGTLPPGIARIALDSGEMDETNDLCLPVGCPPGSNVGGVTIGCPTPMPTVSPVPSPGPTPLPSLAPTVSFQPTVVPTPRPSFSPSEIPTPGPSASPAPTPAPSTPSPTTPNRIAVAEFRWNLCMTGMWICSDPSEIQTSDGVLLVTGPTTSLVLREPIFVSQRLIQISATFDLTDPAGHGHFIILSSTQDPFRRGPRIYFGLLQCSDISRLHSFFSVLVCVGSRCCDHSMATRQQKF